MATQRPVRKIFISTSSFGTQDARPLELLKSKGYQVELNPYGRKLTSAELVSLAQEAVGLVAGTEKIDRPTLAALPNLKIISRCGSGLDSVDLKAAARFGIPVLSTPEAPVEAVAELALSLMLSVLRRVAEADAIIRRGQWKPLMGHVLQGKTVGIVGLGRIGRRLVQLLKPFHVNVIACDHRPSHSFAKRHHVAWRKLDHLLKESDIVSLHVTLDPSTKGLIGETELRVMKKTAILINASRGELIDDRALAGALRRGKLLGAGIDVFEKEPYQGPLSQCPNTVLTCHMGSYAVETRVAMEAQSVRNLLRGLRLAR